METKHLHIGDIAPRFNANTTLGEIKLSDYIGKWLILFSHPGDFTPVCTTEIVAFSKANQEFNERNCSLLGLSVDSNSSHLSWVNNIQKLTGITVPFPLISDQNMKIAKMYNMVSNNINDSQTVRNVIILDPKQRIRLILIYPMEIGRNIYEILRCVDALQESDKTNMVIPANWIPGTPTLNKAPKTYSELIERPKNPNLNCLDWYLCFNNKI